MIVFSIPTTTATCQTYMCTCFSSLLAITSVIGAIFDDINKQYSPECYSSADYYWMVEGLIILSFMISLVIFGVGLILLCYDNSLDSNRQPLLDDQSRGMDEESIQRLKSKVLNSGDQNFYSQE
mmetsp:Transcript_48461/g.35668  ORF Transcript_48461/g.35668 Transcript_48461/m.35668 type:complete len:124 (+) Transcript_48461:184-555(+)